MLLCKDCSVFLFKTCFRQNAAIECNSLVRDCKVSHIRRKKCIVQVITRKYYFADLFKHYNW